MFWKPVSEIDAVDTRENSDPELGTLFAYELVKSEL